MERVNLTKYGFRRDESRDFSDDGTRFTCYTIGNGAIRVSKASGCGKYFIDACMYGNLNYKEILSLPHVKTTGRLNGIDKNELTEKDLIQFAADCIAYEKEYIEAEKQIVYPTIEELRERCIKLREHYKKLLAEAEKIIESNGLKLLELADKYAIQHIQYCYKTLKRYAEGFDPDTYPQEQNRTAYSRNWIENDYDFTIGYDWLNEIKKELH